MKLKLDANTIPAIVGFFLILAITASVLFMYVADLGGIRTPNNEAVTTDGSAAATISQNETIVLEEVTGGYHWMSRKTNSWSITLSTDNTVHVAENLRWGADDYTYTLCGDDCVVGTEIGFNDDVTLTQLGDGRVRIYCPPGASDWHFW